jgi:transcription initiation factor TFIIB
MRQTAKFHGGHRGLAPAHGEFPGFSDGLDVISAKLDLPSDVSRRAGYICGAAAATRYYRITPASVIASAAAYVACREHKMPVTLREIAEASGCNLRDVGRCYVTILEHMHITRPGLNDRAYVHHLALTHPLSDETYKLSERIITGSTNAGLGGRNPMSLAAAALYIACGREGERVTQAELAEAAGVGEASVRECCKAIRTLARPLTL